MKKIYIGVLRDGNSAEINGIQTNVHNAEMAMVTDLLATGIVTGGTISPTTPASLNVKVEELVGRDATGKRLFQGDEATLDCSVDVNGDPTVPTIIGDSRYIAIYAKFNWEKSGAYIEVGTNQNVYLYWDEGVELQVIAGATFGVGEDPVYPVDPLDGSVRLKLILLTYGQTQIQAGSLVAGTKAVAVPLTGKINKLADYGISGVHAWDNGGQLPRSNHGTVTVGNGVLVTHGLGAVPVRITLSAVSEEINSKHRYVVWGDKHDPAERFFGAEDQEDGTFKIIQIGLDELNDKVVHWWADAMGGIALGAPGQGEEQD